MFWNGARTVVLAVLLSSKALPAWAGSPGSASQEPSEDGQELAERALFCAHLMDFYARLPAGKMERGPEFWEKERDGFFSMAAGLMPRADLRERARGSATRFRTWVESEPSREDFEARLESCSRTRRAGTGRARATSVAFTFDGAEYVHRWSRNGQHEFTPPDQPDLGRWTRMVTIIVVPHVNDAESLAALVDRVVANYQGAGKVIRSQRRPRADGAPEEHFVSALLGSVDALETVFARVMLHEGVGVVVVSSYRATGEDAASSARAWFQANAPREEDALMSWKGVPSLAALRALPEAPR